MAPRTAAWLLISLLAAALPARPALGFACIRLNADDNNSPCIRWPTQGATLRSFLGAAPRALLNGTTTWDQNSVLAANEWNDQNAPFRFTVETGGTFINPCGPQGPGHLCDNTGPAGYNPVFFSDTICGGDFDDVIELTVSCFRQDNGAIVNTTIFANATVLWNAYDGPIQFDFPTGEPVPVYDIRRVLLHEFGHVLGLAHPDEAGQSVSAIMNSRVSNLDRLQRDDIDGLFSQSGGSPPPQPTPTMGCHTASSGPETGLGMILAGLLFGIRRRLTTRRA